SAGGPLDAPEWAYRLWDKLHEGLPKNAIVDNYRRQVTAVIKAKIPSHRDKRWTEIYHALEAKRLRRCLDTLENHLIAYHENPNRTEEERRIVERRARALGGILDGPYEAEEHQRVADDFVELLEAK